MKKDDHYLAGSLLRTVGTKGEIILKFNTDLPENIKQLESIFIEVDGKLVPFFIVEIKKKSIDSAEAKLEGLETDTKSQEFIGNDFYLSKKQIEIFGDFSDEQIDVTGYEIRDQRNRVIGKVASFIDIHDNPILKVKTEKGEVLLPANDELIIEIDDDLRHILLNIPDGLIDSD
ncbi:MAG: hypothetical protein R6V23_07445 [Bacteroidales bacterium]